MKFFVVAQLLSLLLLCGCMIHWEDAAAERAAMIRKSLMQKDIPELITFSHAVAAAPPEKVFAVRREFARLHCAEKLITLYRDSGQTSKLNPAILSAETARINLNTLLGFHPGQKVKYDSAGAFDLPPELPPLDRVEKAAMLNAGEKDPVATLNRLHRVYAFTVAAYDREKHTPDAGERISAARDMALGAVDIAETAGLTVLSQETVESAARRVDAFTSR